MVLLVWRKQPLVNGRSNLFLLKQKINVVQNTLICVSQVQIDAFDSLPWQPNEPLFSLENIKISSSLIELWIKIAGTTSKDAWICLGSVLSDNSSTQSLGKLNYPITKLNYLTRIRMISYDWWIEMSYNWQMHTKQ